MATQTTAMSPDLPSHASERSHLVRKLVLLFLLVIASALGLMLLFRARPGYPALVQNWYAVVTLAIVAGFGARWVLTRRSGFVRFIVAMATYMVGLFLLGFISDWQYGIGPLEFWSDRTDQEGLIQVGIGFIIFVLVFLAWKPRSRVTPPPVPPPLPLVADKPVHRPPPVPQTGTKRISILDLLTSREKPVKVTPPEMDRPKKVVRTITETDLPARSKRRNFFRRKPKVQLAIVEEHRCPFCLEPVTRVDPRGVVECDVCHTLHHKDCWEVTGVCQVPHMNS